MQTQLSEQDKKERLRKSAEKLNGLTGRMSEQQTAAFKQNQPNQQSVLKQRMGETGNGINAQSIKEIISRDNGINAKSTSDFTKKKFNSRYIDKSGAWTQNAVNEGYVKFNDYIKDRRDGVDNGISFNDKTIRISDYSDNDRNDKYPQVDTYSYDNFDDSGLFETYSYGEELDNPELEPYTISGKGEDTAGVGLYYDYIWNYVKRKFNKLNDMDYEAVKDLASNLYKGGECGIVGRVADLSLKAFVRAAWYLGAEKYLKPRDCLCSAWLLKHSLQWNPSNVERDNFSTIAYKINNSPEYLSIIDEEIRKSRNGRIKGTTSIKFKNSGSSKDLYYSLHEATITYEGHKRNDGSWYIETTVNDTYDFTRIATLMGEDSKISIGTIANDMAIVSQAFDHINPYEIKINFCTVR